MLSMAYSNRSGFRFLKYDTSAMLGYYNAQTVRDDPARRPILKKQAQPTLEILNPASLRVQEDFMKVRPSALPC